MELESALLIIPPKPVQAFAYPYREEYDPEFFARVPANITLFYPFVPADEVEDAAEGLAAIAARHSAFGVSLDRYGQSDQALFLAPAEPKPLIALYDSFAAVFSDYAVPGSPYHPHLTLARFRSPEAAERIQLPPDPSFHFVVDKIHIYVGAPEDEIAPYIPRSVIALGGKP